MAKTSSDYRLKAARGPFGAILSGVNEGMAEDNKNLFKRSQEVEKRRFDVAKMFASDQLERNRNQYNREQNDIMARNRMFQEQVYKKMGQKSPDPNELVALTTGKFTPAMAAKLGELSIEDQMAVIEALAKEKGFTKSGDREEVEDPGFFGIGKKTRKIPVYSQNQFSR